MRLTAIAGRSTSAAASDPRALALRTLKTAGYWLLVLVLVEALFEGWLLVQIDRIASGWSGPGGLDAVALIKAARNGAYVALVVISVLHVAIRGRMRAFLTPADGTFVLLLGCLAIAGLAGGSSLSLIALAIFVYARGAIVFYAMRGLDVDATRWRAALAIVASIVVIQAIVAIIQTLVGPSLYGTLGITDLSWANDGRAQGLFTHPNHLGHVTALAILGIVAWRMSGLGGRWWLLLALLAFAMGLSQSRESIAGGIFSVLAIAVLQRGRYLKTIGLALAVIALMTAMAWLVQPGTFQSMATKMGGVISAVDIPSGSEASTPPIKRCDPTADDCTTSGIPKRSTRVLLYQQGIRIWAKSPLIGYGVGQFGGGVATLNDPKWYLDPRFGPGGLRLYGMNLSQVDSFWLHLLVETGLIGFAAYLLWLAALVWPSARRVWLRVGEMIDPVIDIRADRWAIGAVTLGISIAFLSPALEDPLFPPLLFAVIGTAWLTQSHEALGPTRAETPVRS